MSRSAITRKIIVDQTDPDTAIYFAATPTIMINRLLPLVPTNATIASYVSDHFGRRIKVERVAELRERSIAENRKANPDNKYSALGEPIAATEEIDARKRDAMNGSQALVAAVLASRGGAR